MIPRLQLLVLSFTHDEARDWAREHGFAPGTYEWLYAAFQLEGRNHVQLVDLTGLAVVPMEEWQLRHCVWNSESRHLIRLVRQRIAWGHLEYEPFLSVPEPEPGWDLPF